MSYYERMLQAEERDPQDLEPMKPRSPWEWYKAVVTGWIQEEDMTEFLLRHALETRTETPYWEEGFGQ